MSVYSEEEGDLGGTSELQNDIQIYYEAFSSEKPNEIEVKEISFENEDTAHEEMQNVEINQEKKEIDQVVAGTSQLVKIRIKRYEVCSKELTDLQETYHQLFLVHKNLKNDFELLKYEDEYKSTQIELLNQQITQLKYENKNYEQICQAYKSNSINNQIESDDAQISQELIQRINTIESSKSELSKLCESYQIEIIRLNSKYLELSENCNSLKKSNKLLEIENESNNSRIKQTQILLQSTQNDYKKLLSEKIQLEGLLEQKSIEVKMDIYFKIHRFQLLQSMNNRNTISSFPPVPLVSYSSAPPTITIENQPIIEAEVKEEIVIPNKPRTKISDLQSNGISNIIRQENEPKDKIQLLKEKMMEAKQRVQSKSTIYNPPYATIDSNIEINNSYGDLEKRLLLLNQEEENLSAILSHLENQKMKTKETIKQETDVRSKLKVNEKKRNDLKMKLRDKPK